MVHVFGTTGDPSALPDDELVSRDRVELHRLSWNNSFSELRNAAINCIGEEWIFFADADEWFVKPGRLGHLAEDLDRSRAYSPLIIEDHSGLLMQGIPRILHGGSSLRYVKRVHEHVCDLADGDRADVLPATLEVLLRHDGYDPGLHDQAAKSQRNATLGELDLEEFPDDPRTLYFLMRDSQGTWSHDEVDRRARQLSSAARRRPEVTANGVPAAWYAARGTALAVESALTHHQVASALEWVDELLEGHYSGDGEYYRAGIHRLTSRSTRDDLSRLMRFRREHATMVSMMSTDGRHVDAMIAALLGELVGRDAAESYLAECESWTDSFFAASRPRF